MIILEIPGKPIPLQRARRSKNMFYDPQMVVKKNIVTFLKLDNFIPLIAPLIVNMEFFFEMPKGWSKKKKKEMFWKGHIQTPDCSNLIKFVEDTFNGKVWIDDKIIVKIIAIKLWSNISKSIIKIEEYGSGSRQCSRCSSSDNSARFTI